MSVQCKTAIQQHNNGKEKHQNSKEKQRKARFGLEKVVFKGNLCSVIAVGNMTHNQVVVGSIPTGPTQIK